MQLRKRNIFTTIRAEGSILPADLLQRINERDGHLKGLTPDDYHLAGGLKLNEAINQSWNRMQGAWTVFRNALEKLPSTDTGTTVTREKWLLPLFQELGYGRLPTAKAIEIEGKSYSISHLWQQTPIHLISARVDLDTRTAGVAGASRISPHGLTQELLNRSEPYLWGFVSNGLRLRILRDNVSLTRQAYVEFDLEAMMNGEQFPDFIMLWLLCHESRVNAERPQDCWLERWSKAAHEQGTRALDQLRNGVEDAIKALGRGFLAHPANQTLLGRLRKGELDKQDYYRQLLRLVYRLLFLFVAEDRELLFAPESDEKTRERYIRFYSVSRLRRLAERRLGACHSDLYQGLRLVMEKLGNGGCAKLGLPALGSFLFSDGAIADLNGCELANHELLEAVRALAFITDGHKRRTVDYKNLRSEELGSVYEALLELHPEINAEARQFNLASAGGNERKTTGSYYTPDSLVQCLLDSALDPVLDEAARQPDAKEAILRLKVVDPACGSGHFLIAAAHRMAKRLAAIKTGDGEPAPEAVRTALREVIGGCIYGVDINPMAVELCKVSLWMEALEPGKPLSFLEHHIQCGNALIGATPALLKNGIPDEAFRPIEGDDKAVCSEYRKLNKKEREGHRRLFTPAPEPWDRLGDHAASVMQLEEISDAGIEGTRRKQKRWEELVRSEGYYHSQLWADAWCAAFVWKKVEDPDHPYPITEELYRKIEKSPWHIVHGWHEKEIRRLAEQYQFLHWHLAFPGVFRMPVKDEEPENEQAGWSGGFDVVLGNPPWERIKLQDKEWFAIRRPEIANAANVSARQRMIEVIQTDDPILYNEFIEDRRKAEGESHFTRNSGRFPFCGIGSINTYAIFAETNRILTSKNGRAGFIIQSDVVTSGTYKDFFSDLLDEGQLVSFYDFVNIEGLFPHIHRTHPHFCLITTSGQRFDHLADFSFWNTNVSHLLEANRHFTLSSTDLALLNSETRTCPVFRTRKDAELTKVIYRRAGGLAFEKGEWAGHYIRLIDFSDHSETIRSEEQLEEGLFDEFFNYRTEQSVYVRLYEAKLFHLFDHRYTTFEGITQAEAYDGRVREVSLQEHCNSTFIVKPRYWVPVSLFNRIIERYAQQKGYLLVYREITNTTNERTCISAILPETAVTRNTVSCLGVRASGGRVLLQANLSAFCFDYAVRQKVAGTHLSYGIMKQLPFLPPSVYAEFCKWHFNQILREWIAPRVLELTYTAYDLGGFAEDCGYTGEPFTWDEERRFLLRCELDAAYFHLYGIEREDVDYILDTFPIVRRKDEQAHGEYRTKRVILEIYDEIRRAMESGTAYRTRLDPPPANGWTPPEPGPEEMVTESAPEHAETTDGKQSDLFAWQAEDPQQQLKFDDTD